MTGDAAKKVVTEADGVLASWRDAYFRDLRASATDVLSPR